MEKHRFPYLIERDEDGWYVATVPDLPGCHTQARSLDQLRHRVKEVLKPVRVQVRDNTKCWLRLSRPTWVQARDTEGG